MNMKAKIAAAIVAAGIGLGGFTAGTQAHASGTRLQTVTKSETIVSSRCYVSFQVTTTYYHWSKKTGWTLYPAPKVSSVQSTVCH